MRAVVVVVEGIRVVRDEVPASRVVDQAIAVVVDAVHRIERVRPLPTREIGVAEVDARVADRYDGARAARLGVPGLRRVDVRVGGAAGLPGVVEAPELAERGIVWNRKQRDDVVGLHIPDPRVARERLGHQCCLRLRNLDDARPDLLEALLLLRSGLGDGRVLLTLRDALVETDDQLPGDGRRLLRGGRRNTVRRASCKCDGNAEPDEGKQAASGRVRA